MTVLYGCPLTLSINGIKGPLLPQFFPVIFPFDGLTVSEGNKDLIKTSRGFTDASDSASDSEFVVESLLERFDDEEGDFLFFFRPKRFFLLLFLLISSTSELEDVLSLLFLEFFLCLSTFLFGEGFAYIAVPTTFSGGSSGESPALPLSFRPVSLLEFTAGGI